MQNTPKPRSGMVITPGLLVGGLVMGLAAFGIALLVMVQSRNAASPAPTEVSGEYRGTLIEPPETIADFTLTNQAGEQVSLNQWRGQWVLLFFGFTHCPDYCPTTLGDYRKVREALGEDAEKVAFVFISVDSERDTPEALAEFLKVRGAADFVTGLTADETTLAPILKDFGVQFIKRPEGDSYTIDHTTTSFLLNPDGQLRVLFSFDDAAFTLNPTMIAGRLKELF